MSEPDLSQASDCKLIIFLQDVRPFEAVGYAGFLELVQHTMAVDSRLVDIIQCSYIIFYLIKQCVCITVYLYFVFIINKFYLLKN